MREHYKSKLHCSLGTDLKALLGQKSQLTGGIFFRSTLTLPRSAGKGRDAIINEYLDETGLIKVIETWMKLLSHEGELPYNPYPHLVWQSRQHGERYMYNKMLYVMN